jgi:nickel transport protein
VRGLPTLALAAACLSAAAPARAHEVLHAVERGRAIAVRAYFPDGEPLAYCEAQVFSPADPRVAWQKGRTDRNGWVAFVPDVAGSWRVRVFDATGHGLDVEIEAGPAGGPGPRGPASPLALALRPVVGIAAIAAVFGLLLALYRRRRGA